MAFSSLADELDLELDGPSDYGFGHGAGPSLADELLDGPEDLDLNRSESPPPFPSLLSLYRV